MARIWSVVALVAWMVAGLRVGAQSATGVVYSLHGRVVDLVTHQPIERALVASTDRRLATMTDHDGNFAIVVDVPSPTIADERNPAVERLQGGNAHTQQVMLMARRPGYLEQGEQAEVDLTKAGTEAEVVLELTPAANISGFVMGEGTAGAGKVQVTLLQHRVQDGMPVWAQRSSTQSDEEGRFRFGELEPGEYTVMSNEWPGEDPSYTRVSRQFPPQYLGDVRTLTAATKLSLQKGGEEKVVLHLLPANYFPVKVPLQGLLPNTQVQVWVATEATATGYSLGWNARDQAVEGALPGGDYTLTMDGFGPQRSSARVLLSVGSAALEHAPVSLAVNSAIPVRVHLELTGKGYSDPHVFNYRGNAGPPPTDTNPVQMYLRSVDLQGRGGGNLRHGQGAEATLEGGAPGLYMVEASTVRGYIASVTSGGIDLLRCPLMLGDGGAANPIDVVVRDNGATVTGEVDLADSRCLRFCSVVLVGLDGGPILQGFFRSDSKFSVSNVAPGTYRAFALNTRDVQRLPYRDEAAMRAFEALGTLVTVSANEQAEVKLRLVRLERADTKE